MNKLYPPIIENTLPSFILKDGNDTKIIIPFDMNQAVSSAQIKGFKMRIRTLQTGNILIESKSFNYNLESSEIIFTLSEDEALKLYIGQFYKVQIAYITIDDQIGSFSSTGVIKCTSQPTVGISSYSGADELEKFSINPYMKKFYGYYVNEMDQTEKVYYYQFDIYNNNNEIIISSGQQLHNNTNDYHVFQSFDNYNLYTELESNQVYSIQYTVITNNKLKVSTPKYRFAYYETIDPEIYADLNCEVNFNNGYVDISIIDKEIKKVVSGSFYLLRNSGDSNIWENIYNFKLYKEKPDKFLFRDFTVEHGKTYQYAIQQYNDNGLYSNKLLSNKVFVDFEDAFLFDGTRQLKIKYNPKITKFSSITQENKIETIGSKYPFIVKNGMVNYKEFPIQGLISYFMDEENLFLDKSEYNFQEITSDLTGQNIAQERQFKMEVLKWLNDGNVKLFRSPNEGNYFVKLIKISLTPQDKVGRMLHSFNCTAYEINEFNFENLVFYNFLTQREQANEIFITTSKNINEILDFIEFNKSILNIKFFDMLPKDKITLFFLDGSSEEIEIGLSGVYELFNLENPINKISFHKNNSNLGTITYSYYDWQKNEFEKYYNVKIKEIPMKQFIGAHENILDDILGFNRNNNYYINPKYTLLEINDIKAELIVPESLNDINTLTQTNIYINDERIDLKDIHDFHLSHPKNIYSIKTEQNVVIYITYKLLVKDYIIEYTVEEINNQKQIYEKAKQNIIQLLDMNEDGELSSSIDLQFAFMEREYKDYIFKLIKYCEREGVEL